MKFHHILVVVVCCFATNMSFGMECKEVVKQDTRKGKPVAIIAVKGTTIVLLPARNALARPIGASQTARSVIHDCDNASGKSSTNTAHAASTNAARIFNHLYDQGDEKTNDAQARADSSSSWSNQESEDNWLPLFLGQQSCKTVVQPASSGSGCCIQ